MNILVFNTTTDIKIWLAGEPIESAQGHIDNGYAYLAQDFADGILTAQEIEVPEENTFKSDLYTVLDGAIILRQ